MLGLSLSNGLDLQSSVAYWLPNKDTCAICVSATQFLLSSFIRKLSASITKFYKFYNSIICVPALQYNPVGEVVVEARRAENIPGFFQPNSIR